MNGRDDPHLLHTIRGVLVPIHPAGYPFIGVFAVATVMLFMLWEPLGWLGVLATAWCIYFFRHPPRVTPNRPDLVVAPADGVVQMVVQATPPAELGFGNRPLTRISIFLNVFNVHVNRVPADGAVIDVKYRPGKFLNANLEKASEENERSAVSLRLPDGRILVFVQVAGLVARRIICDLSPGQPVVAGETYGLIRFGSRTDIYLPDGVEPLVSVGQTMIGGETVLADLAAAAVANPVAIAR
ncbi:phosphatidylserine decarboxylase [Inquilinus sp. CA228]|uniref:phosphatidylserine decarboxylase n=1 Tax=Inquilinus sp. CA228 TaxID=3455609 RepID=UPI003F8D1379